MILAPLNIGRALARLLDVRSNRLPALTGLEATTMFRLILHLALLALVYCALGCKQGNTKSAAQLKAEAEGRKIGAGGMGSTAVPENYVPPSKDALAAADTATAGALGATEEVSNLLRQDLAAAFEAQGYTYNQNMGTIGGKGLPGTGVPIEPMVAALYSKLEGKSDLHKAEVRRPVVDEVVAKYSDMLQESMSNREARESATAAPVDAPPPADPRPATELRFCEDPVGDWKSVREVQNADREVMVEHSENYYRLFLVNHSGLCTIQTYRDNKLILEDKHSWRYDQSTGTLTIIGDDGSTLEQYLIMDRPSEENMIYVKNSLEYHYTLFERIGYGGKPRTKESLEKELLRFEEVKRRISGEEGTGSAKTGKKGNGSKGDKGKDSSGK
jgi:hypothetical protein